MAVRYAAPPLHLRPQQHATATGAGTVPDDHLLILAISWPEVRKQWLPGAGTAY
jgi:hypothetical protein